MIFWKESTAEKRIEQSMRKAVHQQWKILKFKNSNFEKDVEEYNAYNDNFLKVFGKPVSHNPDERLEGILWENVILDKIAVLKAELTMRELSKEGEVIFAKASEDAFIAHFGYCAIDWYESRLSDDVDEDDIDAEEFKKDNNDE